MSLEEKIKQLQSYVDDAEKHGAQEITLYISELKSIIEAAQPRVQRTTCPVPHPQQDFEFICDLCGEHVPARRR